MKTIKFQLGDSDYKLFMQKVHEQVGEGRGDVRKFIEWISRNNFAVLDSNLKSMLKCLPLNSE